MSGERDAAGLPSVAEHEARYYLVWLWTARGLAETAEPWIKAVGHYRDEIRATEAASYAPLLAAARRLKAAYDSEEAFKAAAGADLEAAMFAHAQSIRGAHLALWAALAELEATGAGGEQ